MATVTMILNPGDRPSEEEIKEIETASKKPVKFTEDAPELTEEELTEFKPVQKKHE